MSKPINDAFWRDHLQAQEHSGLTQREYCKRHDLKFYTFKYWRKVHVRLPQGDTTQETPRLIPATPPRSSPAMNRTSGLQIQFRDCLLSLGADVEETQLRLVLDILRDR